MLVASATTIRAAEIRVDRPIKLSEWRPEYAPGQDVMGYYRRTLELARQWLRPGARDALERTIAREDVKVDITTGQTRILIGDVWASFDQQSGALRMWHQRSAPGDESRSPMSEPEAVARLAAFYQSAAGRAPDAYRLTPRDVVAKYNNGQDDPLLTGLDFYPVIPGRRHPLPPTAAGVIDRRTGDVTRLSLFSPSLPILGPDEVTVPESELRARAVDAAWAELARLSRPGSRTAHRYPDPARDWIRLTVGPVSAGYETITLIMSPTAPAWMREIAHRARDEAARTGKSIEWTAQALEARVEVTVEAVGPNGPYQFVSGVFVSLCPTTGAEIWTWPPRTQGSWGARSAGIGTPVGVAAADPMRTWKRAPDASGDYTRHIWAQEDSIVLLDYCEATGLARVPYGGSYRTYRVPPSVRRALKPWSPPGE